MTNRAKYVAAHRDRVKAAGLKRVEVTIPKHREAQLKALVAQWKEEEKSR